MAEAQPAETGYPALTGRQRDMLFVAVRDAPANGSELANTLEKYRDERLRSSVIYGLLGDLVDAGLLTKHSDDDDGRAKVYDPTDRGREIAAQRAEWTTDCVEAEA